ncbi:MAG: hypothetical protein KGI30_03145 [Planctomycetota bacterium]|nr:hypothetical protein [Planctomycetota bacterium]
MPTSPILTNKVTEIMFRVRIAVERIRLLLIPSTTAPFTHVPTATDSLLYRNVHLFLQCLSKQCYQKTLCINLLIQEIQGTPLSKHLDQEK